MSEATRTTAEPREPVRTPSAPWAPALAGVALVVLAGLVAGRVFTGRGWLLPVLAGAVVPAAVALGVGRARGWLLGVPTGAGALALLLALGLAPGRALGSGGRRLLTAAVPLEPTGGELAAVVLTVGVLALLAVLVALTARAKLAATVPGLLGLAAALAVSAAGGGPPAGLLACAALVVGALLVPRSSGTLPSRARAAAGAAALLVVAAVLAGQGSALPGAGFRDARADARDLVDVPVRPRTSTSPLARFAGLAGGAERTVARLSGAPVDRLRLATLDRFDGDGWSTQAIAVRASTTLPSPPVDGPARRPRTVQVDVELPDLLDFLLTPGRATAVSVAGLGVVPSTGDLLVPADRRTPTSYVVTGGDLDLTGQALRGAAAARTTPRQVPPAVLAQATRRATGATSFARLAALERSLAGGKRAEGEQLPSGSGLFQITTLLRDEVGTAEQYTSAFAVLAGALGYDTRVVVGFRPAAVPGPVLTTDVTAWPEVRFEGLGWLPFAPTPSDARGGGAGSPEEVVRRAVEQEAAAAADPPPPPVQSAPVVPPPVAGSGVPVLPVVAALLLLTLLAVLAVPVVKLRRSRRRRVGTARDRVLGAWREAVDQLGTHGLPRSRAATTGDVVAGAGPLLPDLAALRRLRVLADWAAWSPFGVDDEQAGLAWRVSDEVRATLRADTPIARRVAAALDPRPLLTRGSA